MADNPKTTTTTPGPGSMPSPPPKPAPGSTSPPPGMKPGAASNPKTTTPDYINKQMQLMAASAASVSNILVAIARLKQCSNMLAQAGANFDDVVFTAPSQFVYTDAYHADLLLQTAVPNLDAFLDTVVDTGFPTYRELFNMIAQSPP